MSALVSQKVTPWPRAWLLQCFSLGLHVVDEALTDFLGWWNPAVQALQERWWVPLPTFKFGFWFGGLMLLTLALILLTPQVRRGARWMVPVSYAFAIVMLFNALGHTALSFYLGRPAPGVYSTPLILATSVYLLMVLRRKPQS